MNFFRLNILLTLAALSFTVTSCQPQGCETKKSPEAEVLTVIHGRTSIREFTGERVDSLSVDKLMRAGMAAPTGKGLQPWHFVVINDRAILDQLATELPNASMLSQAPMAIVVCGDTAKSSYWYLDCALASENILLAAHAIGLGATYTASYPYADRMQIVVNRIGLPPHILPLVVIPVGYPATEQAPKEKYDPTRIHTNQW